jgi:hypothetical protein
VDLLIGNPVSVTVGNDEELERKARFFAKQKMRPYDENTKQTPPPGAYAKRHFRPGGTEQMSIWVC